ncbi:DarT ssDNA thymidine ADP-ribosyltransferase family protein [Sphingobacterium sp. HMA12]|uniref:DarT ssDNA thymidine ADP-ribosyltransferase family protein n=1 Tax=Sphingobacterium sp. HMA12 TaxID=2050894 RepID=UPI000CEA333A|nr:DarT ssDNA thymidine ADP-ribosyltransferase family protein [Sphingobacterium sp. HMA12]
MATPDPIYIFRMVHWQNIQYILTHGLCSKNHRLADPNYVNIGDRMLIAAREDYTVPIAGYGTLGDYIPFFPSHTSDLVQLNKTLCI